MKLFQPAICVLVCCLLFMANVRTDHSGAYAQESKCYEYNVTAYGALGDAKTLNTKAIQQTRDTCAKNGGGTVVIPP